MIAENVADDGLRDVKLLNVKDLANCLRVSVRQCWRLDKKKLIPAPQRIGTRIVRWRATEIAAWQEAGAPARSAWEQRRATQAVGVEGANKPLVS